jgi:hypothetical protein
LSWRMPRGEFGTGIHLQHLNTTILGNFINEENSLGRKNHAKTGIFVSFRRFKPTSIGTIVDSTWGRWCKRKLFCRAFQAKPCIISLSSSPLIPLWLTQLDHKYLLHQRPHWT